MVQLVGLDGAEVDSAEDQNKLDDLQAKKQHMDQLLAQISHLNGAGNQLICLFLCNVGWSAQEIHIVLELWPPINFNRPC